jgi:signal transduction histidine kinase
LHIRASNAYGVWNEEGKSIRITILSPWWRTWWAYAAYVVIFVLLLFVVDRAMRKRLALREQEKNRARELAQAKEIEKAYHKLEEAHEDLKSAQQQLVQQEKLASLGQLTAGIAHEIKNPLNFVNNFSELSIELIDEVTEEFRQGGFSGNKEEIETQLADIKANLLKICQHGTRADGIVKSMLQHSRGGNGKLEPTDLNALISEFVNLAFHGMRAAKNPINVMLDFEYDESLGHVDLIAEDFSRVVLNLSNNAFDAMREKVQINPAYRPILSIRTIRNGETIAVSVSDNGSGIPDSIKDKILQPFFTTKKGTDGTGLGLSITHDIIKAHGGSLEISSENQEGSTFRITLPVK